jgi:NDP-sugar pyrophosphorylase family protein
MKAVLLAAGLGTRLAAVAGDVPKILAPLGGEPLLAHQLRYLAEQGCDEVTINLHHRAELVQEFLGGFETPIDVRVSLEPELLGTAGALHPMREFLDRPFVLLYGDVVTNVDLAALLADHERLGGLATLVYYDSHSTEGKGLLQLDDAQRVIGFLEKASDSGSGHVNAGIYALDPEILSYVPPRGDFGFDVWPAISAAGRAIFGHESKGYVHDIGTEAVFFRVNEAVANGTIQW